MPRLARLDAPGILHHVMGRGIERKRIFIYDTDRTDFIDRLAAIAEEGSMDVYAWVLMPISSFSTPKSIPFSDLIQPLHISMPIL